MCGSSGVIQLPLGMGQFACGHEYDGVPKDGLIDEAPEDVKLCLGVLWIVVDEPLTVEQSLETGCDGAEVT